MSVRRLFPLLLIGAVAALAIVSCGERSLVVMQVESASPGVAFSDVDLVVRAREQEARFDGVSFGDDSSPLRAGMYLSSDVSGSVVLKAEVDDPRQNCVVGMGSLTVGNVSPGNTVGGQILRITSVQPCVPIVDGGTSGDGGSPGTGGSSATGGATASGGRGGSSATGGAPGTGGAGHGGTPGSGGAAAGGSAGTGGVKGTGGAVGSGGTIATGGTMGSGGMIATGGAVGAGGVKGTGGLMGSGGTIATGGTMGSGGTIATGGTMGSGGMIATGGTVGSGGMTGTGGAVGSGGTGGCKCPDPNEICDSTGGCVCTQTAAEACSAAGADCGTTTNICGQTVSCGVCPASSICSGGTCVPRCSPGTGGIVAASPDIICPLDTTQ